MKKCNGCPNWAAFELCGVRLCFALCPCLKLKVCRVLLFQSMVLVNVCIESRVAFHLGGLVISCRASKSFNDYRIIRTQLVTRTVSHCILEFSRPHASAFLACCTDLRTARSRKASTSKQFVFRRIEFKVASGRRLRLV